MCWLSFCLNCGDTHRRQTWIKWHNPMEKIQTPGITSGASLSKETSVWDSPVLLAVSLFSVASVSTRKDRFHHKGCLFSYRGETCSSLWSEQSVVWTGTRHNFRFKTKKQTKRKPQLWEIWHWPNFLWKIPKLKPLQRERKC